MNSDTQLDFISTTFSPSIENVCKNLTQTPLDAIEDRINVVVPYLVVLGNKKIFSNSSFFFSNLNFV